jgi:hypothetical protein
VCEPVNVIYRKRIILHNLALSSALMAHGLTPPHPHILLSTESGPGNPDFFFGVQILYNKLAIFFLSAPSDPMAHRMTPPDVPVYSEKTRKPENKRIILELIWLSDLLHVD